MPFRVLALSLAVVLLVMFATPAKAEALEPMTILAIAGAAVIVVVLLVYLVVANVEGPRMSQAPTLELPGPVAFQEPSPAPAPIVLVSIEPPHEGP
jgi:hypothetical protein